MKENILVEKSFQFAKDIISIYKVLIENKKEYIMSKQLLRSGTSIGASIRESQFGQSKPDFINKLSISLKEASETEYWLLLLHDASYIQTGIFEKLQRECKSLMNLLAASIITAKANLKKP